jgi:hypothetical protein
MREKNSNLQQVIVHAFYNASLKIVVLTTIDKLVVFIKLDEEKVFLFDKQVCNCFVFIVYTFY